jgi:protoheme IX farnesyltransferase
MVLVTTALGYILAARSIPSFVTLVLTLMGTGLAAAGSAILNNYLERITDGRMHRTRNRALPAGRIDPEDALLAGIGLVLGGVILLAWQVNLLSGFLVLLTAFLYVLVYTPLKRLTWLNTPVGAIPGALPTMVGWAAAANTLDPGAWVLFGILFAWQHPHFYAIAWMHREDYRRAGFQMLSVVDPSGRRVFRQAIAFSVLLLGVSLGLYGLGLAGPLYLFGAVAAGAGMITTTILFWNAGTVQAARRVLLASIAYLPAMFVLILLDLALTGMAGS